MKEYQKPEVVVISLKSQEAITTEDSYDGSLGTDDSIF